MVVLTQVHCQLWRVGFCICCTLQHYLHLYLGTCQNLNILMVEHKIYIAVCNFIIVMDALNSAQIQCMPRELPNCSQIYSLVPTINVNGQSFLLVANCSDRYFYFDPMYGDWTDNIITIPSGSKHYICPDNNYDVTCITNSEGNSQVTFSERDSSSITLTKTISSGLCFESQNKTYFTFSDLQSNRILVHDFSTQNYSNFPIGLCHLMTA